jgi:hypothetical protein
MTSRPEPPVAGNTLDRPDGEPIRHVSYPHLPGRLYDCPACEARCHCTPGDAECIYAGVHSGVADN